jgi:coenzyme F420-reducing hydrogenase alpha subunit
MHAFGLKLRFQRPCVTSRASSNPSEVVKQMLDKRKAMDKERVVKLTKLHDELKKLAQEEIEMAKTILQAASPSSCACNDKNTDEKPEPFEAEPNAQASSGDAIMDDLASHNRDDTIFVDKSDRF